MTQFPERRTQSRDITKDIVILYHGKCSDGFGAAYAAWKKFGDTADYVGVEDHDVPPAGLQGKEIYMADFTYNKSALERLMQDNSRVTAIDHHESVEELTRSTFEPLYRTDHSGAVLAWQYFHPSKRVPALLEMIEDIDLWRLAFPHSKEYFAYLDQLGMDFVVWDGLAADFEDMPKRQLMLERGREILTYQDKLIAKVVQGAEKIDFAGHTILAVNSPLFQSEVGNQLCQMQPPFSVIWRRDKRMVLVSLRSDGTFDVGALAAKYGGGGHPVSAGFTVPTLADLPFRFVHDDVHND